MAISFTQTPGTWAALVVAKLKAINPEITGASEAELLKKWTAITEAHQAYIPASLLVTTTTSTPFVQSGQDTKQGTGTSA